jgi:hypothetical protein
MDLTKLSNDDLKAISEGRIGDVSNAGLRIISAQQPETQAPIAEPSIASQIGRQLGLTARAGVTGAAGLPLMFGEGVNALLNLIAGREVFPSPTRTTQRLLTQAGLPEPQTAQERIVQDVASGIAGVGGGAAMLRPLGQVAAPLTERLGTQTAGAVGATTAAGMGREEGASPMAQLGLAALGGTITPSAGGLLGSRGAVAGREIVRPFTEAGREVIAGNVLRQLSAAPDIAAARASAYQSRVPGYTPTTAQATRDVGLISAETPIRALDVTGKFTAQQSAANQARLRILDQMAKEETALANAIKKRDEVTTPLREEAFAKSTVTPETFQSAVSLTVNKTIDDILQSPAGRRGTVTSVMEDTRADIARARTPQELYEIRKDLRAAERGLLDKSNRGGPTASAFKAAQFELNQVIRSVDDAIEAAAPGYRAYLDKYATSSRGIEALKSAQEVRSKVLSTTPDPSSVGDFLISQPAFTRVLRQIEAGGFEGLSKPQIATLKKIGTDLDEGVLSRAGKVPGSDTFKNMSTANVIGGIIGKQIFGETSPFLQKVTSPMNWLYNGTDDKIRELLVDAMLDPKLASKFMAKATTANVESIGKELQRRAINLGYGSIFGLTE